MSASRITHQVSELTAMRKRYATVDGTSESQLTLPPAGRGRTWNISTTAIVCARRAGREMTRNGSIVLCAPIQDVRCTWILYGLSIGTFPRKTYTHIEMGRLHSARRSQEPHSGRGKPVQCSPSHLTGCLTDSQSSAWLPCLSPSYWTNEIPYIKSELDNGETSCYWTNQWACEWDFE